MRIAVSGSHASGKSTLIDAFLARHPEFAHEPEPYVQMDALGEVFGEEPTEDDFRRQLDFCLATLAKYSPNDNVIFDRSPIDFLAYIVAIRGQPPDDFDDLVDKVAAALPNLDLIAFLPLDGTIDAGEEAELREDVDEELYAFILDDELELFEAGTPLVIQLHGGVEARYDAIRAVLHSSA